MPTPATANPPRRPARSLLAKSISALALGHVTRGGIPGPSSDPFPGANDNLRTLAELIRSAVPPADTYSDHWAAELYQAALVDFEQSMIAGAASAFSRLRQISRSFDFRTGAALAIPFVEPSPNGIGGGWIGEKGLYPAVGGTVRSQALPINKIGAIAVATNELIRGSGDRQFGKVVEQLFASEFARIADVRLTGDAARIDRVAPPGLRAGVAGIPTTGTRAGDLAALFAAAERWSRPALLLSRARLAGAWTDAALAPGLAAGRIGSFTVIDTPNMADPEAVIACDASQFASVFAALSIIPGEAPMIALADADPVAPSQSQAPDGTVGEGGVVAVNDGTWLADDDAASAGTVHLTTFQNDLTAFKGRIDLNWSLLGSGSVAWIDGATW